MAGRLSQENAVGGEGMSEKIPEDWIKVITQTVLAEREKQEKEAARKKKDYRFRNTELLCKNYRRLSAHCEKIPEQIHFIHEELDMEMFDRKIDLKEVMKSKQKTRMMMEYIDAMILAYKKLSYSGSNVAERRFNILYDMYLNPHHSSPNDLFEKCGVERSTFYRDLRKSINEFSVVLFGIDAYEFFNSGTKTAQKRD